MNWLAFLKSMIPLILQLLTLLGGLQATSSYQQLAAVGASGAESYTTWVGGPAALAVLTFLISPWVSSWAYNRPTPTQSIDLAEINALLAEHSDPAQMRATLRLLSRLGGKS